MPVILVTIRTRAHTRLGVLTQNALEGCWRPGAHQRRSSAGPRDRPHARCAVASVPDTLCPRIGRRGRGGRVRRRAQPDGLADRILVSDPICPQRGSLALVSGIAGVPSRPVRVGSETRTRLCCVQFVTSGLALVSCARPQAEPLTRQGLRFEPTWLALIECLLA